MPNVSEEERKKLLSFVVVGGGPTGVEFAAELNGIASSSAAFYPFAIFCLCRSFYTRMRRFVVPDPAHFVSSVQISSRTI